VVEIRTTKPLLLPTESEMAEFVRVFMEEEFLILSLKPTDERPEIVGKPLFMPELFAVTNGTESESDLESEPDARYLQSEEAPAEPIAEPLSFNWTVTNYTSMKIEVKLFFSEPGVLSLDGPDKLGLSYAKPEKFLIYAFNLARAPEGGFDQSVNVPLQLDAGFAEALEGVIDSSSLGLQIAAIGNVLFQVFSQGSL